jgi:hypothetical protein
MEEPQVVAARPMLHDLTAYDTPDVDERPGHLDTGRLGPREQRHRRRPVHTPHRHMPDHELTVGDEMVLLHVSVTEVMVDGLEDLAQSIATLWPAA